MSGKGKKSNHERIGALFSEVLDDPMTIGLHTGYLKMLGGDSNTAILLAQIVFYSDKGSRGESFYKSTREWTSELGLSKDKINRSRKVLEELGIITVTAEMAKGSMTNHYTLNAAKLQELITEYADTGETIVGKPTGGKSTSGKPTTHCRETHHPLAGNPPVALAGNPPPISGKPASLYTEITTEITNRETTESTQRWGARDFDFDLTGFDELWSAYPNKAAKGRAEAAWIDLDPDKELQAIMLEAVEKQRSSPQWEEPRYIPHLANWINDRRWEDEIDDGRYREPDDSEYGGDVARIMAMVRGETDDGE